MEDALVEVLTAALSGDSHMRIPAEDQLAAWETEPGFCALLLEAAAANELNHDVRLLACLVFKNLLDRRWRPSIREYGPVAGGSSLFTFFPFFFIFSRESACRPVRLIRVW